MSYIVSKDGKVTDAMIEDSSGSEDIERSAVAAVRQWVFKPATRDGEPVEHPMTRTVIKFQIDGRSGATKQFMSKFKEINGALAAADVPKAEQLLTNLEGEERHTLYEDAWYSWLRYNVLKATKTADPEELMSSLSRAVGYEVEYLTPDVLLVANYQLFVLRVQDNDLGGALEVLERLKRSKTAKKSQDYERLMSALDENAKKMQAAVAGPAPLLASAHVGTHDYWVHPLMRRSFALSEIQGELEALEVRCKHHNVSYAPVTVQHTWTVPSSWEKCGVYVHGTPGASFKFYEYPDRG